MAEPVLAVSFHTLPTSAALVAGDQWGLLTGAPGESDPTGGPADQPAGLLARLGAEAHRRHGARVERLAVTGSGHPPEDAALLAAGRVAGFPDVEVVPDAVAAVLDPANGADYRPGEAVFTCDLGTDPDAPWRTALVRIAGDDPELLARRTLPGGPVLTERLRAVAESCAELAAAVGADPAAAVLTGGWPPSRSVVEQLERVLPGRLRVAAEPQLAVLRGLIRWLTGAGHRRVASELPAWRVRPVSWRIPDHDARVVRWRIGEGTPFTAGTVVAQVRTCTDRVYDLTAATDGVLLGHRVGTGSRTGPHLVVAAAPATTAAAYDPPPHRHRWSTTGAWMLTSRRLVEWDGAGRYVQTRELADGAVAGELRPDHGGAKPQGARVIVAPTGRFCLLTWDLDGEFWVWDIAARTLLTRFATDRGPEGAGRVLINEERWRLAVEARDAVSVGRYRRTAVTFWDLATGQRVDKLVSDDWGRRQPGYRARSVADRFTAEATDPDGRLRAAIGEDGVSLYETATERRVFRAAAPRPYRQAYTAFSADGRFLLATWEADDRSTVDVWQL